MVQQFRKLQINLPREPVVNERPWMVAGVLFAFIILLMSAYAWFNHNRKGVAVQQKESVFSQNK